jgi:hypothetical protein
VSPNMKNQALPQLRAALQQSMMKVEDGLVA